MSNYKVKVNNEAESREVQLSGEKLGYVKPQPPSYISMKNGGYVCLGFNYDSVQEDLILLVGGFKESDMSDIKDYKELTTQQLRDLVVLKRNDKNDRNVIDPKDDSNLYLDSNNNLFVFHLPTQTWKESKLNGEEETMKRLKPIAPLKEYLVPQGNGKYALTKATEKRLSDWVEVPEGAEAATFCKNEGVNYWKENGLKWFSKINKEWCIYSDMEEHIKNHDHKIVWTRHTQPEELPFVDDEPKASTHGLSKWFKPEQLNAFGESAKKVADSFSKLSKGISIPYEPKSLNDTYAEIEQVRQDNVNNPSHYSDSSIECIDAMEAMMTPEQFIGYLRGNVFKYQWRYEKKNGIEDLKKAQWYLDKLVAKVNEKHAIF